MRLGGGLAATLAASVIFFIVAPPAFAGTQQSGGATGQPTVADSAATPTAAPTNGNGNAGGNGNAAQPPSDTQAPTGADTSSSGTATDQPAPAPAGNTLSIDPGSLASGLGSAASGPSDGSQADASPTADPGAPNSTGQSATSNASTKQQGPKNDNASVRVGNGGGNGPVDQGNNASSSASSNAGGGGPKPGNGPGSGASADSTQSAPSNTNIVVRVDSPGDTGPVAQTNQSNAAAAATGSGTADSSPAGTGDVSGGPSATSSAQSDQTTPSNTNIDVRVSSPGDAASVNQANTTQAVAASTSAIGFGPEASASATQTSPGNVNVVIRVGSPGDNGSVTEQNSVGATAGPSLQPETPAATDPKSGAFGTDQLVTTSGNADVTNTGTLDQEVEQVQSGDGPANQAAADGQISPSTAPTSISSTGTAAVEQTGAANTNVSVRIASPGNDGAVKQKNNASAVGTNSDLGVVVSTDRANTDVSVVVPGAVAGAPDSGPWVWNWVWSGNWTPPNGASAADVAPTDTSAWDWVWQTPATDAPTASTTVAATTTPGTWTWNWTWTGADGQTWTGSWQQPCECSWTWTWTWDWSAGISSFAPSNATTTDSTSPPSDATAPAATTDIGAVTQSNSAISAATASVETSAIQSIDQSQIAADPTGAANQSITAEQTLLSSQNALAAAEADQTDAWNLVYIRGAATGSVSQGNNVSADAQADADATIVQGTVQRQTGGTATVESASATQWLANTQGAIAAAEATQTDSRNIDVVSAPAPNEAWIAPVEQTNSASAAAAAIVSANLEQWIGQYQTAGLAIAQGADATQLLGSSQTSAAAAVVAQTSTWNLNDLVVPDGSRATNPSLRQRNLVYTTTTANDSTGISQWILQVQDGIADVELSSASQEAGSSQSALALSPAQQTRLLNSAGWLGIEPPITTPEPGTSEPGTSALEPSMAAAASVILIGPNSISSLARAPLLPPQVGGVRVIVVTIVEALRAEQPEPGSAEVPVEGARAADGTATHVVVARGPAAKASTADEPAPAPAHVTFDLLSAGAAGSAPSGGAGAGFALAGRPYKLVAPAHLGPRMQGPTLGRSVDFVDPLERPG